MKRTTMNGYLLWVIGLLFVNSAVMAQVGTLDARPTAMSPVATIQSVNNAGYMSSGSAYTAEVYEVGSTSPSQAPGAGMRNAGGPGTIDPGTGADVDPNNPQFAPVGDGVCLLTIMALLFALVIFVRSRKLLKECL